uniref:C-myc promoter-binding protein n=3 Tax=Lygus hesperus TaxID=30085 RepID=A0A0A9WC26_LYGHE
MDERKVVDYFVIAGLPPDERQVDDLPSAKSHSKTPITDIAVIFPALGETLPEDYTVINKTPTGLLADLNHGSLRSPEVFLCFRRGRDKPPLVDIGVMYEGKERILSDSQIVDKSLKDHCANVNNSASKTFLTYRRASPTMPCNSLVVTDIAVIITNKGETVPHAFCCIKKNLNRGLVGSDVFICYKKSVNRPCLISYKPGILLRYPFDNRPNLPLPESVPMFCMPMGCSLEKWPKTAQQPTPIFSTFVLTVSDAAEKLYGSAVTFYEPYAIENLADEQKSMLSHKEGSEDWTYHINKCICLLSRWPFFDTYERFLNFLYEMSRDSSPHTVSIERFITYFLEDIPFPGPQRPRILVQLSQLDRVILTQPEDLPLPRSGAGFRQLLLHLGPDNCLLILLCALTEQKILVHSLRPDVLTAVAEAISMIMFPFKWQCPYIPLCPLGLAEVLHAPLPFLIGVDSRFFDLYDPPSDVNCVDLDTNNITFCDEKRNHLNIKLLPKKAGRALRSTLEDMCQKLNNFILQSMDPANQSVADDSIDKEFPTEEKKSKKLELEIQEAFLKFMAAILKGYRNFLLPITKAPTIGTTDTNSLFDLQGFLRTRDKAHNKFFSLVTKTQMFIRFIEERSFVSDMDAGLAFFDECTEKVESEDENYRLLEVEGAHYSEHTVFIPPPESQLGQRFHYDEFTLDVERFKTYLSSTDGLLKAKDNSSTNRLSNSGAPPGSPMARRTKYEIKVAQKLARKWALTPRHWAHCLLSTCYSIWFIHLPSYVLVTQNPSSTLGYAYDMLIKLHRVKCRLDEICYRVMMQLCGVYRLPVVAVLLLMNMKRERLQPNAITYGFYNRAVLEATWPSGSENSSQLLWNKLRNVIMGAALFRRAGLNASKRRLSTATEDSLSIVDPVMNCGSRTSIDSAESLNHKSNVSDTPLADCEGFAAFERFRTRVGSIVRPSGLPLLSPVAAFKQQPFDSSAGLLITGLGGPLKGESIDLEQLDVLASPIFPPPSCSANPKRYFRSGSCTEFSHNQLRQPPTSPPKNAVDSTFKLLTRSESFAHDAGILAKLNMIKMESSTVTPPEPQKDRLKNTPPNHLSGPKPWQPKILFKRRRSLTLKNFKDPTASDSYESSNENLGSTGSGGRGSFEDIYNNMDTPKRNRLFNALGARLNKLNPDRHSTGTIDTTGSGDQSFDAAKSPVKSPSRTPVTENDPLGALDLEENEIGETAKVTSVSRATSEIELDQSGAPVLFDRRTTEWNTSVVRSATFINEQESDEDIDSSVDPDFRKPIIHRSSTMPSNVGDAPFQSGFSSFKIPSFTRYSPARFSLRKAADKINTQMIENAITSLSPSSLTSKKSNELIMGGLSSLKSAATSVAKKFDEIKGAISANSTPNKSNSLRGTLERDACLIEDESEYADDMHYARRKISSEFSPLNRGYGDSWGSNFLDRQGEMSRKGSTTNLGEASQWTSLQNVLFPNVKPQRESSVPFAMEVILTTCSKCHNCSSVLYDEEIMAGWTPEDSNLNTKCQFCEKATVPLLTVTVIDYRNTPVPQKERKVSTVSLGNTLGTSRTSLADSTNEEQPKTCEPIAVPYLNPLVLRKELESILAAEGDSSLTQSKFVDEHPIIYWNMVWMFTRINIESHMFNLVLGFAGAVTSPHPSWANITPSSVLISTMWHNPRLHDEVGQPMYLSWNNINSQPSSLVSALVTDHKPVQSSTMEKVISYLQCNDLVEPLKFLAVERQKLKGRGHSLYREILFLGITALGRENIDQGIFDKEYQLAYDKLPDKDPKLYLRCDQPISLGSIYCRQTFRPLDL